MRVLLVEDEKHLADAVASGLGHEGFVVDVAGDGITGQWLGTQNPYDVIVLDIMLPGRNGYDVLAGLRRDGVWAPVLMLTAKDGDLDQVDAFDLGADDYLTKPFSFPVLVARLRALARRGAPERPTVLDVGGLMIDPARHVVMRGDVEISLTAKEFALLLYLARRGGEPASKPEVLDNVWGADFEGNDNVVEVYVGYLRRKIDAPFGTASLETVRGHGYRLVEAAE